MAALAKPGKLTRVGHWSLIAAAVLMGAALLFTVWSTNAGVREAADTLTRGQSLILMEALRSQLRSIETIDKETLEQVLDDLDEHGLRYIAVLSEDGQIAAQAGDPDSTSDELARAIESQRPNQLVPTKNRIRVVLRRPRRGPRRNLRRRRTPGFVLEFAPQIASNLEAESTRSLTIGGFAAGLLLLAAVGLMRWVSRREALERQLEHGKRLASLGQMSAILAHEIRNPLASLKGNAQLLERSLDADEKAKARANRVVEEAIRLEGLTNDLLEFAREGEIERADIDPGELLRGTAETIAPDRIEVDIERAPARWPLDGDRMRQVLGNLLENAVAASGDEAVTASASVSGGKLELVIRDRGDGIDEDDLDKLFEPFFTRKTRGTGLGLAVSKRIVDLHGGTITAANAEGGGAVFRVTIPKG